jgi:anti-anti-sigma factor
VHSSQDFATGLHVAHELFGATATIRIGGPLTFPDAVAATGVVKHVVEQSPSLVLLDLTEVAHVDATGVAVLVGIGGDLKQAGIEVRVVAADPRIRHRLPYTLGLRKVFATVEAALRYQP